MILGGRKDVVLNHADSRIGFNLQFSILCNQARQNGFQPLEPFLNPALVSAPFRPGVRGKFDLQPPATSMCVRDCRENNLHIYEGFTWRLTRASSIRDVLI